MKTMPVIAGVLSLLLGACQQSPAASVANAADDSGAAEEQLLPDYEPEFVSMPVDAAAAATAAETTASAAFALNGETESYYMTIFGYQGRGGLNLPRNSHTFAVFVKAAGPGDLDQADLSTFVISWLPDDGLVGIGQPVKRGRNYTYEETMAIVAQRGFDLRRSPIYQIDQHLFEKALARKHLLESGAASQAIRYKMIDDMQGRSMVLAGQYGGYTNCIHAVADSLRFGNGALLNTGAKHGFAASDAVFQFFSGRLVNPQVRFDGKLAGRLGL